MRYENDTIIWKRLWKAEEKILCELFRGWRQKKMLLTETILKCGSSEQVYLLQLFCILSSLWLRSTQVWFFVTNYLLFCPPWCSWRGSGWRVWGVQNSKGGLRVPQGQVWVWRHPAVQQPALLSHAPRTPDPCGVPHHDLWAGQGAHSFSSKCVQQKKTSAAV